MRSVGTTLVGLLQGYSYRGNLGVSALEQLIRFEKVVIMKNSDYL